MAKSKLTPEVRSKIEYIAALDGSVEEMAYYCNVSRQTIYNWLDEESDFFDKKLAEQVDRLRARPILKARETMVEKISESYQNAADYLKRKRRKEFGDNIDMTTEGKELPAPIIPLNVQGDDSN